jgi:hypothetical protein
MQLTVKACDDFSTFFSSQRHQELMKKRVHAWGCPRRCNVFYCEWQDMQRVVRNMKINHIIITSIYSSRRRKRPRRLSLDIARRHHENGWHSWTGLHSKTSYQSTLQSYYLWSHISLAALKHIWAHCHKRTITEAWVILSSVNKNNGSYRP